VELDFFDFKGVIESLVADLHLPNASYQTSALAYLHPGRAGQLLLSEKNVGSFGQLHPTVTGHYGLGNRAVLVAELDLESILANVPERYHFAPVPRFPSALRDIAIVVEEGITAEQVIKELRAAGGDLLSGIRLFDVYRGESIPPGTKSLAFALSYQALDRTLTDKEVDKAHKKIEERVKHVLKAQVRGEV
jgi:phenylalanyl-tRNA synthetase beta chain